MTDSEAAANRFGLLPSDFDYDPEAAAVAERFLGDVGCGVDEADALRLEGGTAEMMRSWEQSRRFRRALAKVREQGVEEREYAARKAERRQDVFATPPRPGQVDLAAVEYDPQAEKPRGGLAGWLRRIGVVADRQAQRDEPATRPNGTFIAAADMTPQQLQTAARQETEKLQRAEAERATDEQPWGGPQKWGQREQEGGEHIAPDGSSWVGAPAQQGGGLFTAHGNPDSVPTP